ncbi:hypothetical protein EJB05_32568, partial [Eragrostis curvula]
MLFFAPPPPPAPAAPGNGNMAPPAAPPASAPQAPAPPAAPQNLPQHAFFGLDLIDAIHAYPQPRLPTFPIVISITTMISPHGNVHPLLLTWHKSALPVIDASPEFIPQAAAATASPLPSPVSAALTPPTPQQPAARSPPAPAQYTPPPTRPGRCPAAVRSGARMRLMSPIHKRRSNMIAAKEKENKGQFVNATDKATQLKALQNSLDTCSHDLQDHVKRRGLLGMKKTAIANRDLRKLVTSAGLGGHVQSGLAKSSTYRAITTVALGNGASTSFWHDVWFESSCFSEAYPALYSHCVHQSASVRDVVTGGILRHLVPRLTSTAEEELNEVQALLNSVQLTEEEDVRHSPFIDKHGSLKSAPIYKALMTDSTANCDFHDFVWINHAPPRARFFTWLLVQGRIHCRSNLLMKNIVDTATCELCQTTAETPEHLIFGCSCSQQFWRAIHVQVPDTLTTSRLWETPRPTSIPSRHYSTFLILCCWHIWKHRNEVVFRNAAPSIPNLLLACKEAALLWRCRIPNSDSVVVDSWCSIFHPM